ncbi:Hypothetical Protein FCC1311_058832 [Hondaea fermentalgiana]|uniref:Uncharacterized protein n=1 Tax=Hondaea fermentalgiana TaxID=2315210 RepID=A0A2R5GFH0_9STRA|nr:Hypothetical Protein FCC1311_058832 [Hondaea fermentalgiana]|eukprot:GBG29662.1 Hypothetical Protein FCC1311_058832 [Hondaea fermentalgiana]
MNVVARLARRSTPAAARLQGRWTATARFGGVAPWTQQHQSGLVAAKATAAANWSTMRGARSFFSEAPTNFGSPPTSLSVNQAIAISETVLMYMELGLPGDQLDEILKERSSSMVVTRLRKMLSVYIGTQLYVLGPFGFAGDQQSIEHFARLQMQTLQGMDPNCDEIKELQKLSAETWNVLVKRSFGIKDIPELTQDQIRFAATRVSANLQDPTFLKMIEDLYNTEIKTLVAEGKQDLAVDKLQDALVPCYINVLQAMNVDSLPATDEGYVLLQVCMNQNMADPAIAQAIMSGFSAVQARAPVNVQV